MRKSLVYSAGLVLLGTTVVGIAPTPAFATTVYDDIVHATDELVVRYNSHSLDITDDYLDYVSGDYGCKDSGVAIALTRAMNSGAWAVRNTDGGGGPTRDVDIVFSNTTDEYVGISTYAGMYVTDLYDSDDVAVTTTSFIRLSYNNASVVTCNTNYGDSYVSLMGFWALKIIWSGVDISDIFLNTYDVHYPAGYAGDLFPGAPARETIQYVALGDSYSSGEGNPSYIPGSDTLVNTCHRSLDAWPVSISRDMYDQIDLMAFRACSGAISNYIFEDINAENIEPEQGLSVWSTTDIVSISIGGNDVGFANTIITCMASNTAQGCLDALDTVSANIADPDFVDNLEEVFSGIRLAGKTSTQVLVVGYPRLYPEYENISGTCTWGSLGVALLSPMVSGRTITKNEIDAFSRVHDELNTAIDTAVENTSDSNVHFVDPTSVFSTHEICGSSTSWLHEIYLHASTADFQVGSFHPNSAGIEAYADLIGGKIEELTD